MFRRIVCRSVTKGRLNVAECLVRTLCRFMVQTMVTETDEKVQEEVGFFWLLFLRRELDLGKNFTNMLEQTGL